MSTEMTTVWWFLIQAPTVHRRVACVNDAIYRVTDSDLFAPVQFIGLTCVMFRPIALFFCRARKAINKNHTRTYIVCKPSSRVPKTNKTLIKLRAITIVV